MLCGVPNTDVDAVWPRVEHLIEDALEHSEGEYTLNSIYEFLRRRDMQLWLDVDGREIKSVAVSEIINWPNKTICQIPFGAGKLESFTENLPRIKAWAAAQGATHLRILGRPGWERALPEFHRSYVCLGIDL